MKNLKSRLVSLLVPLVLILPSLARAQEPVGIVTALKGTARLTRKGTQSSLSFKDSLVLRDIIDTQESSLVRVLFGGKSTVTVRELSRLEVTEELLPGGGVRSVHNLSSGSILVNVARRLMKKGDEVVIRTPNAVGAVRGTIIFAQYNAATAQSTFVLLTGKAVVTPLGQPPITLTPDSAITVSGDASVGVQAGPVVSVSKADSKEILEESETGVTVTEEANQEQTAKAQTEEAAQLASAVVEMTTGETTATSSETEQTNEGTNEESEAESSEQNSEPAESNSAEPATEGTETATNESAGGEIQTASNDPITGGNENGTPTNTPENTVNEPPPVTAGGTGETVTETTQNSVLTLNGETQNLSGQTLYTFDGDTTSAASPFIEVINSNVQQTGSSSLILVSSGANATVSGTLLDSDPSTITTVGDIFRIEPSANLSLSNSLFTDIGGTITAGDNILAIDSGAVTGTSNNPFINFNNSTVSTGNEFLSMNGGSLNLSGPLLTATNGSLSFTSLLGLTGGASLISGGSLMDLTNLNLNLGTNSLVQIANASTLNNTSGPLFRITGGSLTADALVNSDDSGNTFDLTGSILDLTDTTVTLNTLGHDNVNSSDPDNFTLSLQSNEPIVRVNNSTLHVTGISYPGELLSIDGDDLLGATFDGTALIATNNSSVINDGGGLLDLLGDFSTTSTQPLVQINNSSVTTKIDPLFNVFVGSLGSTNINMAGPLASVGSTLTSEKNLFQITGGAVLTSTTTDPFLDFNNATVNVGPGTAQLFEAANGHLFLADSLLHATNSNLTSSDSFLRAFSGSQITSSGSNNPFILLDNSAVSVGNELIGLNGSFLNSSGPLLKVTGGSLSTTSLLNLAGGAILVSGGSLMDLTNLNLNLGSNPLIQIAGGSTLQNTSGPVAQITGGSLTANALVSSDNFGNTLNLTGSLLDLTNTSVTLGNLGHDDTNNTDFVTMSLQGNEPILKLENSTLHVTGTIPQEELISIDSNNLASSTFDGLALIASNNSAITNDGGGLLSLSGNFSTTSTEPLVQIDSSNVTTKIDPLFNVFVETLGSTNINMVGPLASVGSTLSSEKDLFKISGGGAFLTSNTMSPFIYFDNATVNVGPGTAQLFEAANGQLSLMGPLLDAMDSTLNLSDSFLKVYGGSQITSMNPDPLVSLSNTSVMPLGGTLNHLLYLDGFGTTISVADSMFTTQNSDLTFNNPRSPPSTKTP